MSFDLAVWYPHVRLSDDEAATAYRKLCEGEKPDVIGPHPSVQAFYEALTSTDPEIDSLPEERLDDCRWSCALDRSPAHVIMASVWSKADSTMQLVGELAQRHGLVLYDPQRGVQTYPRRWLSLLRRR